MRGGAAVERRVAGEGGRVISSVYGVVSQRHPASPACSGLTPLTPGQCSRVRESRSGGGDLCCRRGGGWFCQSPVFSSYGQGPPPLPLLFRTLREETESKMKNETNEKVGPLLRRLCGWTALGRAGGQAGAAAAWGGTTGPAACCSAFQTF